MRRDSQRAQKLNQNRKSKIELIKSYVEKANRYLTEHKRARVETAVKRINQKIGQLKLEGIIEIEVSGRELGVRVDQSALEAASRLDGCYVIKTNAPAEDLETRTAHDRYKDLLKVEFAFKTMKRALEEIRPVYVRKEAATQFPGTNAG